MSMKKNIDPHRCLTIPGPVRSPGLVARVLGHAAVRVHIDEIQGPVHAARQIGDVNDKGELAVLEGKLRVVAVAAHQIGPGANVRVVLPNDNQLY